MTGLIFYLESAGDAKNFKEIGVNVYEYDILGVPILQSEQFAKLREAFNQFGVKVKDNGGINAQAKLKSKIFI